MKWEDVDLDAAEWCFPISKRKRGQERRELIVPLSRQAVDILRSFKAITGFSKYVLPSEGRDDQPWVPGYGADHLGGGS
jgi:integrase